MIIRNWLTFPQGHNETTTFQTHTNIRAEGLVSANVHTFFTPRIFFALFFLSFICLRDFSTLVARPFCRNPNTLLSKISRA
jgi:hypothetical protein